jgi:hypothetical protein
VPPEIDVFAVLAALLTALDAAISGVRTTVALIANPETSSPSRAMPRELTINVLSPTAWYGSVNSSVSCPYR